MVCNPVSQDFKAAEPPIVYSKLVIRLDHLLNLFLVERLLLKHGRDRGDLLRISFEMVVLSLQFWTHKHRWGEIQGEFQWLVSRPSLFLIRLSHNSETKSQYTMSNKM